MRLPGGENLATTVRSNKQQLPRNRGVKDASPAALIFDNSVSEICALSPRSDGADEPLKVRRPKVESGSANENLEMV